MALAAGALAVTAKPANATYTFCNRTSFVLASAIAFEDGASTESRGWYVLQPGQCQTVLQEALRHSAYYAFAQTLPVHAGGVRSFAGNKLLCTTPGLAPFKIVGQDDCERRGYVARRFSTIKTNGNAKWTTTFGEPSDYTLEEARVAGVQRLLADMGIDAGRIDGYLGAKTRRALVAFKQKNGLEPDLTLPNALYDALVKAAQAAQEDVGLSFCNDTGSKVWAAIGYEADGETVSTGWFGIESRRCTRVVKGPLTHDVYYTFAETESGIGRRYVWGGGRVLCTMDNRFTIREHKDCEKRGYVSTGFARIDAGGKPGYVQRLSADSASQAQGAAR